MRLYAAFAEGSVRPMFFRVGFAECLIVLVIVLIVAGLAFRGGYWRGKQKDE